MAKSIFDEPRFQDPQAAREYLEALRWPSGAVCPHCGGADRQAKIAANVAKKVRPGLYDCGHCHQQYTVTVGTVFERSKIALHKWLMAATLIAASKKGMSSHQLHRMLGVTYKTAWFMSHRLREAMKSDGGLMGGGGGVIEADETYIGHSTGGRRAKRRNSKKVSRVLALVDRDGTTRAFAVSDVTIKTLKPILQAQIAKDTHLMTDSASQYRHMNAGFQAHEMINHLAGEYAKPSRKAKGVTLHTNTVEAFFGMLKRGLHGTYHHVSQEHLQRYCEEFSFRYSYRTATDADRADMMLRQIGGKRLTYRRTDKNATGLAS